MIVRPWEKGDTAKLKLQPAQSYLADMIDAESDLTELSDQGLVFTGEIDGKVVGIAGLSPQWENRAIIWSLLSEESGAHFVHITKVALRLLEDCPFRRVEATVDVGFEQGHRWIKMLGFELEGYMKAYRPDGADMILYARVKK